VIDDASASDFFIVSLVGRVGSAIAAARRRPAFEGQSGS
jgi:hypothetical protein